MDKKKMSIIFGASIELSDLENNSKTKYKIVGHDEADIEKGLLSYKSPVASSLIGKVKGDLVTVSTPKGEKNYEVVNILYK